MVGEFGDCFCPDFLQQHGTLETACYVVHGPGAHSPVQGPRRGAQDGVEPQRGRISLRAHRCDRICVGGIPAHRLPSRLLHRGKILGTGPTRARLALRSDFQRPHHSPAAVAFLRAGELAASDFQRYSERRSDHRPIGVAT